MSISLFLLMNSFSFISSISLSWALSSWIFNVIFDLVSKFLFVLIFWIEWMLVTANKVKHMAQHCLHASQMPPWKTLVAQNFNSVSNKIKPTLVTLSFEKISKSYIKIFWQSIQKHWRENRWHEVGNDLNVCVLHKALSILLVVSLTSLKKTLKKVKHKLLMHVQNEYRAYSRIYSESLNSMRLIFTLLENEPPCRDLGFRSTSSKFWMNI